MAIRSHPGAFILDSASFDPDQGRFTILGFDPIDEIILTEDQARRWPNELSSAFKRAPSGCYELPPHLPFVGGWVGYVSYEAGAILEEVLPASPQDIGLPSVCFRLYDTAAVFDQVTQAWLVAGVEWHPATSTARPRPPLDQRLAKMAEWLQRALRKGSVPVDLQNQDMNTPPTQAECHGDLSKSRTGRPQPNLTRQEYTDKVKRLLEHITAGNVYQVNLAVRFETSTLLSPTELYLRLRRNNPAPFGALLHYGQQAVLSSSPERFLHVRGGHVVTRPIKGTRPRIGDPILDELARAELRNSEKDRAELNMIIDLLRNDLGRVCRYGSVKVTSTSVLEEHPTVFHQVATICGELAEGCTPLELLAVASPGGSISGCPKIRAMQLIREIEPHRRDVYCGSIGYVGLDGSMSMNLAIRTMMMDRDRVVFHAGSGIVIDSDPDAEHAEILAKARGMFRALGSDTPVPEVF